MTDRTFRDVLDELAASAQSNVAQGQSFERLVKAFLEQDKAQSERFRRVWLWTDWPGNAGPAMLAGTTSALTSLPRNGTAVSWWLSSASSIPPGAG